MLPILLFYTYTYLSRYIDIHIDMVEYTSKSYNKALKNEKGVVQKQ